MTAQDTIKNILCNPITDYLASAQETTMFWLIIKVLDQSINKSQVVIHGWYSSFAYFSQLVGFSVVTF